MTNLLHGLGNQVTDLLVSSRDGGGVGDLLGGLNLGGVAEQALNNSLNGLVDTATQSDGVGASHYVAQTLVNQGLSQNGSGGGTVTGDVVGLLSNFLGQLSTDLLERLFELDLLGDGDAVVGDGGGAPLLV